MRVRLLYKPKPDNYTESCMVNVTDGWRERNESVGVLSMTEKGGMTIYGRKH